MDSEKKLGIRNLIIVVLLAWVVVQAVTHRNARLEWRGQEIEYLKEAGKLEAEANRANAEVAKANAFLQRLQNQAVAAQQRQKGLKSAPIPADMDNKTTETTSPDDDAGR